MSAQLDNLPTGWARLPIEKLFAPLEDGRIMHQGWSPQCEKDPSPSDDKWGVLKTTSIQAGEFQPKHNKILPEKLNPRPLLEVKAGDILITCAGPRVRCGVSCLVRDTRPRLMISGKMYRFRAKPGFIEASYLEAFLQTEEARQAIDRMKTGGSDSGLNLTHERFRQLNVKVAPIPEQRRIVGEIEKQFSRLEEGVGALKRVQANLKRYRAAVLKAACEGRLVPTEAERQRSNRRGARGGGKHETGEELLARILAERRKNWQGRGKYKEPAAPDTSKLPTLPEGWVWASIGQLKISSLYGPRFSSEDYADDGYVVLRTSDISESGKVDVRKAPRLRLSREEFEKYRAKRGDLLVTRTGSLGTLAIFDDDIDSIPGAYLIQYRLATGPITTRYLFYFLKSPTGQSYLAGKGAGVGRPNLNAPTIEALAVPLPPLAEQSRIVAEVERRLSVVEEMEATVEANLQRATRLRQSILQKAFEGKLV